MKHNDSVNAASFSPDGENVMTGSGDYKGGTVQVWHVAEDTVHPLDQPIQGDPEQLLAEWQKKLGLKLDEQTGRFEYLTEDGERVGKERR